MKKKAKLINAADIMKKYRPAQSGVESLSHWPLVKATIDDGLPPQAGVELMVTDELAEARNIAGKRTVSRFLKKYVESIGKAGEYTIKQRRPPDAGFTIYYVVNLTHKARSKHA